MAGVGVMMAVMGGCQRLVVLVLAGQWELGCCCLLPGPPPPADEGLPPAAAAAGVGWLAVLVLQAMALVGWRQPGLAAQSRPGRVG